MHEVTLITDGSCPLGNPGPGGCACLMKCQTHERVLTGGHPATTNNRMELMAAIEALRVLKRPCRIELQTDSQYVKKGMTEWLPRWQANGWKLCRSRNSFHYSEFRDMPRYSQAVEEKPC
ncbi:MAG: RNase H family protein [Terriglobia bacterium]